MYPYIHVLGRTVPVYGLCMVVAILLVGILSVIRAGKKGFIAEDILIVAAVTIGMALLGGRVLYLLVSYPISELLSQIMEGNILLFSGGGLVFYGGLFGGVLGAFLGIRIAGCDAAALETCVVPYVPLGHAIGRIGCLLAGCCHGIEYDGFLAVHYVNSIAGLLPEQGYFPVQGLEAVLNVGICVILLWHAKRTHRAYDMTFAYLGCYAVVRFCLEFLRGDGIRGVYHGLSTSQWISLGLLWACIMWGIISRKSRFLKK